MSRNAKLRHFLDSLVTGLFMGVVAGFFILALTGVDSIVDQIFK